MSSTHYLGRQLILDSREAILGYEFFTRSSPSAEEAVLEDPVLASARVLISIFSNLGSAEVLAGRKAFVNFPHEFLDEASLALFPKDQLVLESEAGTQVDPAFVQGCKDLRAKGYTLALDNFLPNAANLALLPLVSYVKLNIQQIALAQMAGLVKVLRKFPVKLIACRVETQERASACREAGFDYFQGYYFARPALLADNNPSSNKLAVIQLLNLLMGEAEISQLEEIISRDAALSFKLLRLINSAAMGQGQEVSSIRRALITLGRQQLYRWLTLILFAGTSEKPPSALVTTAVVRGRLAELLGQQALQQQAGQRDRLDQLFITGMFSLMEPLLQMPLPAILKEIRLPQDIVSALVDESGPYGPILALVKAIEAGDGQRITQLSSQLLIGQDNISRAYLEAMAWAANLNG